MTGIIIILPKDLTTTIHTPLPRPSTRTEQRGIQRRGAETQMRRRDELKVSDFISARNHYFCQEPLFLPLYFCLPDELKVSNIMLLCDELED